MGSEIRMPNHLKIRTNERHFLKTHLESGQKHLEFKWSGFQMVWTMAIAIAKA